MLTSMLQLMGLAFARPPTLPGLPPDSGKSPKTASRGIKQVALKTRAAAPSRQIGQLHGAVDKASVAHDGVISAGRQQVKAAAKKTSGSAKAKKTLVKPVALAKAKSVTKAVQTKDKKPAAKPKAVSATRKAAKPQKKTPPAVAKTKTVRAVAKPAAKPASKVARKPIAKVVKKPAAKPAVKKPVAKNAKPAAKAAVKPVSKPTAKKITAKPAVRQSTQAAAPARSPAKGASGKPVAVSLVSTPPHLKTGPTLVNVSPPPPAPTKARSSRTASLTVPSMAQAVASTAAKSSYSQLPAPVVLMPLAQAAPVKNPKLANNWKTKPVEKLTDDDVLAMPDAQYMNEAQLAFFRLKLLILKTDILNSAGETTEHLREETVVVPDPADRATIEEEHALELRTRDRERKLLKKIEQSIGLIDNGDYGYCDETGEPIGVGRLLARPTATLSLEAQQRRELRQKMFGD